MQEKGPAVSSDVTYMVLGFLFSLPFRERQAPVDWNVFILYIKRENLYDFIRNSRFGMVIFNDQYFMKFYSKNITV